MKGKLGIDLGNINYDRVLGNIKPRSEDTIRGILMSLGSLSDKKKEYIVKRLKGLNSSELINLKSLIYKEEKCFTKIKPCISSNG